MSNPQKTLTEMLATYDFVEHAKNATLEEFLGVLAEDYQSSMSSGDFVWLEYRAGLAFRQATEKIQFAAQAEEFEFDPEERAMCATPPEGEVDNDAE